VIDATRKKEEIQNNRPLVDFFPNKNETENPVCAKLSEDLSIIRSDRLIGFVCPKYFLSDRKISTIIVKVGVILTFTLYLHHV
jgi:hypothetical protein